MINNIVIEDPIETHITGAIEVIVEMNDGSKRWCFFLTPQGVTQCGDLIEGTKIKFHYGASHMFIVSKISKKIIEATIMQVEKQGELERCTLPIQV